MKYIQLFTICLLLQTFFYSSFTFSQDEELEETIVISAKYPVPLSEVIGSVDSINLSDMESRQISGLRDLLDNTIGVSVSRDIYSGRAFNNTVSIRGMGGKRVNLLIDGVRFGETYQGYGRDLVDTELLKRVEILKGPSSALYGSDGLAGALLYITKDPSDFTQGDTTYQSVSAAYDSDNEHKKASYLLARSGDKAEALVQLTARELSESELHADANLNPNPFSAEQSSVFVKTKYAFSDNLGITLTLDSQNWEGDWELNSETGTGGYPVLINTSTSIGDDEGSRDRIAISLDFSADSGIFDNGSISIYSQETDQTQDTSISKNVIGEFVMGMFGPSLVPNIPPTPILEYKNYIFDQSIEGFSMQFYKKISTPSGITHNIVYGAEQDSIDVSRPRYRTETNLMTRQVTTFIGGEQYPNKTFPDTETVRTAYYFNNRVELNDTTSIVFGARNDSYELNTSVDQLFINVNPFGYSLVDQDDSKTSLKFGFIKDIAEDFSFFYQYAEGFRSPDFYSSNLSFTNFAFRYTIVPNANLGPEESEGTEFGFRGKTGSGNWSLAFYDNDYEDFIDTQMTGFSQTGLMIFEYQNLEGVNIEGVEFQGNFALTENLEMNFGLNKSTGTEQGQELTTLDPDRAIIGLLWTSDTGNLTVDTYYKMRDGSSQNLPPSCTRSGCADALTLPDYNILDSFIGYQVSDKFSVQLALRNITDKKYWNWSDVAGSSASDENLDYFLNPGINYSITFRYSF